MARRRGIIFGDTSGLIFDCSMLAIREETQSTVDYPPGEENAASRKLREIDGAPILEWPPLLPDFDPRGHRSVTNGYRPGKKAKASRKGLSGYFFCHKAGTEIPVHSDLERRLLTALELCPYVIEIRAQYSEWDPTYLAEIDRQGRRIARHQIMTIDIMVTLKIPGCSGVVYHAISGKPSALVEKLKNQKRHKNERDAVKVWGATHEVQTELTVPWQEYSNNLLLLAYMKNVDNIAELAVSARAFADVLKRTRIRGMLDRVIEIVARRFGWNVNTGYRIFAVAHFLGYLVWNHDYKLALDKPMMLKNKVL